MHRSSSNSSRLRDIFHLLKSQKKPVGTNGFISIVDAMPRLIPPYEKGGDYSIANAARVSYQNEITLEKPLSLTEAMQRSYASYTKNRNLIRFLVRNQHTSPLEMAECTFHVKAPIFVARQWMRHRTASVNEWSARYSRMPADFYEPLNVMPQSADNKQGSDATMPADKTITHKYREYMNKCKTMGNDYHELIDVHNVSKEQARIGLPVGLYTQFFWKCDLHNILRFLKLRMAPDAQLEIREYAEAMYEMVKALFPVVCEAFEDYELNAVRLTSTDIKALRTRVLMPQQRHVEDEEFEISGFANRREYAEFVSKYRKIFGTP